MFVCNVLAFVFPRVELRQFSNDDQNAVTNCAIEFMQL